MTPEQHKQFSAACTAFGDALERIFKTEAPKIERQEITGIWEGEPAYTFKSNYKVEIEKDWEILEIRAAKNGNVKKWTLQDDGGFHSLSVIASFVVDPSTILDWIKAGEYSIHSVRRLSDNTVWTVGQNTLNGPVQKFEILGASIRARVDMGFMGLPALRQPKKAAIFTTADGVEVYEKGTPIYKTSAMGWIEIFNGIPNEREQWYSTREAAEKAYDEWLYTRPVLSIWDFDGCSETGDALTARLKQLVKDKIAKR